MSYTQIGENFITLAARDQYGSSATITNTDGHAYGWKAVVNGQHKSIDLHGYSAKRYGSDYRVLLTDLSKWGWKWFNPFQNDFKVCPILFIPADQCRSIEIVRTIALNFLKNINHPKDFYFSKLGKTFTVLDQVQLIICYEDSKWFEDLSKLSLVDGHRFDYLNQCRVLYENSIKRVNPDIIYVASVYCGNRTDLGDGAAAVSRFIMLPPNNCVLSINPEKYDLVNYAVSHEIGHGLGLHHPAQDVPERKTYLMGGGVPPYAKFLDYEVDKLKTSQFLV